MFDTDADFVVFSKQIKDVLENLYDFVLLERHPLADNLAHKARPGESVGQCLRRIVLLTIQNLNPTPGNMDLHDPQARGYNLIHMRYVDGMTIQEAAFELGLSERQAYRHLVSARESLASILWRQYPELRGESDHSQPSVRHKNDTREVLMHAVKLVERLAEQHSVEISMTMPNYPILIAHQIPLARQVLISIISRAVQHISNTTLHIAVDDDGMRLNFSSVIEHVEDVASATMHPLIEQLGWSIKAEDSALVVSMTTSQPILLVIDDDSGLGMLVERYLTHAGFQVTIAESGMDGIRMAQQLRPYLIILDVMMPEMDGWEVLQRLKANERTQATPVVICSIFNDRELACSLGAAALLPKPLRPDALLSLLEKIALDTQ